MKQKLKNYLKLGILLFGISLVLYNCDKDDVINKKTETLAVRPLEVSTLNKTDIQNNKEIANLVTKINNVKTNRNTFSKTVLDTVSGISINTDYVKYIQDNVTGYHSFTFPVTNTPEDCEN